MPRMESTQQRLSIRAAGPTAPKTNEVATIVLLIRHGHTDAIGRRLTGRLPGVDLSDCGRLQAERLVPRVRPFDIKAIYTSPLERARQTAQPLARSFGIEALACEDLNEVRFGRWSGLTFEELDGDPGWRRFNTHRNLADVPDGEGAVDVQIRVVGALESLWRRHPGSAVAVVSHADVIRAAVLHYAGMPLDLYHRIEIAPASITALRMGYEWATFLFIGAPDGS